MAHISWVIRDLRGGGAERVVLSLANGLCERGHRVDLVLFFPVSDYPERNAGSRIDFRSRSASPLVEPDAATGGKLVTEEQEAIQERRDS